MDANPLTFFTHWFETLTGQPPYPWQRKLFLQFIDPGASWPEIVDLPTGSGKTSIVYVWLLAYAWNRQSGRNDIPRRLVWIVNRRVVVDQVTFELEQLGAHPEIENLLGAPLALSTLRGELADNGKWSRDPSRPAIVVGTVDLIGSALLFRGYRASPYFRPIHAGLLGIDSLIVNDEAHLSDAFARLLGSIGKCEPAARIPGKSFRFLLLSATQDNKQNAARFNHEIEEDARESPHFHSIFNASKRLSLHEAASLNELKAGMWRLATESPAPRTAVFIEQPEKALEFAERLIKQASGRVELLTGTMRGYERDALVDSDVFKRFAAHESGTEPVWLVCTSAGEVGVNFSCDRLITELAEADRLLQRFGRMNRFAESAIAEAHVLYRKPSDKEPGLQAALAYVESLAGDASCANVWRNPPPPEALTEKPAIARLENRLLDIWAQTTYPDRHVPPVAAWLHGKEDAKVPTAELAWRSDVSILAAWQRQIDPAQIAGVLEYYPVLAREKITEPAYRVADKLRDIQDRILKEGGETPTLIVVNSDGTAEIHDLAYVLERLARDEAWLDYKMLLLPDTFASLSKGMFSTAPATENAPTEDVADRAPKGKYQRVRFEFSGGEPKRLPTKDTGAEPDSPASFSPADLSAFAAVEGYKPALVVNHPDDEGKALVYFGALSDRRAKKPEDVLLDDHQRNVAQCARRIACDAGLEELANTLEKCGLNHDYGKARDVWQIAMGGSLEQPRAKTKKPVNPRLTGGYRHELGSLLDLLNKDKAPDDLLLHLIASHHKAARPYFEPRAYDRANLTASAWESAEAVRRYARLQDKYGHWGLAYLEALFKCADGITSRAEGDGASA